MSEAQPIEDAIEPVEEAEVIEPAEVDTETPEIESEAKTDEGTSDSSPGKKDAKSRIDELTKNWREAQRENERLRARLDAPAPKEPEPLDVRTLKDFDYDEAEYQKHVREVASSQAQQEYQTTTAREAQSQKMADFRSNEAVFAEKQADYYDVTNRAGLTVTPNMAAVIQDSDQGPAIHYHLGQNVELSQQLAGLPPVTMARRIGQIEAALSNVKPKKVSDAPEPAAKLKTVSNKTETDPYKMDREQYRKWSSTGDNYAKWRRKQK